MKNVILFTILQILISSLTFGVLLFLLNPMAAQVILICGAVFGTIPCLFYAALTKYTFKSKNFTLKSMCYWFLSFVTTLILWVNFTQRGTGELRSDYIVMSIFGFFAAIVWWRLSAKLLKEPKL
jgi:predicted tellurium resistance membrane protein TerC